MENNQNATLESTEDQPLLSWESQDAFSVTAGNRSGGIWFWVGAIIILAYAIWQHNWILAVVVVVVGATWMLFRRAVPQSLTVVLSGLGVSDGHRFWKYDDLNEFTIELGNPSMLRIRHKSRWSPDLAFVIHPDSAEDIRSVLSNFLPEKNSGSWVDKLSNHIGL